MKTKIQLLIVTLMFCLLFACSSADSGTVEAFVGINCGGAINHDGDDVYAYVADNIFFVPSIQAGGHTNGSTTDLGVNIFARGQFVEEGDYAIASGGQAGTAYVYFQPTRESGYEFISDENQGVITVTSVSYTGEVPAQVAQLSVEFDNVMMTNYNTGQDTCISDFKLDVSI